MALLRPFCGVRPAPSFAAQVASLPYDVLSSKEAAAQAKDNPYSFFHVGKAEIDLPPGTNLYSDAVYAKAKENLQKFIRDKVLLQDDHPCLYIYRQIMQGRAQYGLVGTFSVNEYAQNKIKKHELTRQDKEDDRTRYTTTLMANTGPVFLTYRDQAAINQFVEQFTQQNAPVYDFTKEDQIQHTFWVVDQPQDLDFFVKSFAQIPALYIADGHHRNAAALRAQEYLKGKGASSLGYDGQQEYDYYLAVAFPASHLKILDYNRVIFSLGKLSKTDFMAQIQAKFKVTPATTAQPPHATYFGMYLDHQWYQLQALPGTYDATDPVASLDVSILQNNLLGPILGITNPRTDKNIDFVGGIRGTAELVKRVDSGEAVVAFALYPTSITQLLAVADAELIMPPKSTWFEPKLRSGLIIHRLDQ